MAPEFSIVWGILLALGMGGIGFFAGRSSQRKHFAALEQARTELRAQVTAFENAIRAERARRDDYERELMIVHECLQVAESRESQMSTEIKALTVRLHEARVRLNCDTPQPTVRLRPLEDSEAHGENRWGSMQLQ